MFFKKENKDESFTEYIINNFKSETFLYTSFILLFLAIYFLLSFIGIYNFTFKILYGLFLILIIPFLSLVIKFIILKIFNGIYYLFKNKIKNNFSNYFFGSLIILSLIVLLEIYFIDSVHTYSIFITPTLFLILLMPVLNIFFGKTKNDKLDYI